MIRSTGAQVGLLAFSVAVLAGITAGNSAVLILTRGLIALFVGAVLGQVAGWTAKSVLRDHLLRRKQEIDRKHIEAVRAMVAAGPTAPDTNTQTPVAEQA